MFMVMKKIKPYLTSTERITIIQTDKVIDMGETDPIRVIRNQRDSSMVMALQSVKDGVTDGCFCRSYSSFNRWSTFSY